MPKTEATTQSEFTATQIRRQLDKICDSNTFADKEVLAFQFRLLVGHRLAGAKAEDFTGEVLAKSLGPFLRRRLPKRSNDNPNKYDAGFFRQLANRLRDELQTYYFEEGFGDPIVIGFALKSLMPQWTFNYYGPLSLLSPEGRRLVARARALLGVRTLGSDSEVLGLMLTAADEMKKNKDDSSQYVAWSLIEFSIFVTLPRHPSASYISKNLDVFEHIIPMVRKRELNTWEAYFSAGCLTVCKDHKWREALDWFEMASMASQGDSLVSYWWHTALLASLGKTDSAIAALQNAISGLGRTNLSLRTDLAMLYMIKEDFESAKQILDDASEITDEDNPLIALHTMLLHEASDTLAELSPTVLLEQYEKLRSKEHWWQYQDTPAMMWPILAMISARVGNYDIANEILEKFYCYQTEDGTGAPMFWTALVHIGFGDYSLAELYLEYAVDELDPHMMWFHIFPPLRHLRGNLAYKLTLEELGLDISHFTKK